MGEHVRGKRIRDKEWDTFSVRTLTRAAKAYRRSHNGESEPEVELPPLPTRDACRNGVRPCPHVRCRHNLLVDVGDMGTVRVYWDNDKANESCSLDVAERGSSTLYEVADILRLTRQRMAQLETQALARLREALERRGLKQQLVREALEDIAASQHKVSSSLADPVDTPKGIESMTLAARACLEKLDREAGRKIDVNPFARRGQDVKPDA